MTLDELLHRYIGDMGCYQMCMFILLALCSFCGVEVLFTTFLAVEVPHICAVPALANLSYGQQENIVSPLVNHNGATGYSKCTMFDLDYSTFTIQDYQNWNRTAILQTHKPKVVHCKEYVFHPKDFSGSVVEQWLLVCGRRWLVDLISTITISGCFLGAFLGGAIADRFGRRPCLLLCCLIKLLANGAAILATNYIFFSVARFFIGFATSSSYLIAYVLLIELVGPSYRNTVSCGYTIMFSLGFMLLPLVALLTKDANVFNIVCVAPMLIMLLYFCTVPESPRWLLLNHRNKAAMRVLEHMASINGSLLPSSFNITTVINNQVTSVKSTVRDLVATPLMRRRSLVLFFGWFTVSLIYYSLSLNAGKLVGNMYLNTFLMAVVEVPATLTSMWLVNLPCVGRRKSLILCFFISGLCCLACVPVIQCARYLWLSTVFVMTGKAGATAAFNILFLYTSELYPTQVRNLGVGVCSAMARASGTMASYAGDSLAETWQPLPSLLFGILGTLSAIVTTALPETFNTTLLETIQQVEDTKLSKSLEYSSEDTENAPLIKRV